MTSITQTEISPGIVNLILNRPEKGNALDDKMIARFTQALEREAENDDTRVLVISANGKHFCTGADLAYMQQMVDYSVDENIDDAKRLSQLFNTLYAFPKPTIAMIHGATYGGGLGIIAAADIAISTNDAVFCFSEVKLGLIPATIAPYVVNAIGPRHAKRLFLTAEQFDAETALSIGLVHQSVAKNALQETAVDIATIISRHGPNALTGSKKVIQHIAPIDSALQQHTAELIASSRTSEEAQSRLREFLGNKNR